MTNLVHLLNDLGRLFAQPLWRVSIELAVLAAVVTLVLLLLRMRSPALRHLFWALVLAKPVAAIMIASPSRVSGSPAVFWSTPLLRPRATSATASGASSPGAQHGRRWR